MPLRFQFKLSKKALTIKIDKWRATISYISKIKENTGIRFKGKYHSKARMFQKLFQKAIKKANASKVMGPDKIATMHLKNLDPKGLSYLTDLFNL